MSVIKILGVFVSLSLLAGCAIGQKIDVRSGDANVAYGGSGSVAVAAHDRRPYILDKDKMPEFVGLMRGGYGNPFDVVTVSGKPLANELAGILSRILSNAGYSARPVVVPYSTNDTQTRALIAGTGVKRGLLLTVKELKSDTYMSTGLNYDLVMEVTDGKGRTIASASAAGEDNLGSSAWNPPKVAKNRTPDAVAGKLAELLDRPAIHEALVAE